MGPRHRREVAVTDRELVGEPVVERDVGLVVVAEGATPREHLEVAIGGHLAEALVRHDEAVHGTAAHLLNGAAEVVVGVDEAVGLLMEDADRFALAVGVGEVVGGHLHLRLTVGGQLLEVVIEGAVLHHDHDDVIDGNVVAARVGGALGLAGQRALGVGAGGARGLSILVAGRGDGPVPLLRAGPRKGGGLVLARAGQQRSRQKRHSCECATHDGWLCHETASRGRM